jgi:hypothetical protein
VRLPDFLIIGAMKAGTTTLYYDLMRHPGLYLPEENKEPHSLVNDRVLTTAGRAEYADYFRRAAPNQLCGEGSTGYSKLPDHPGVYDRARELLGADLRVIYVVREPVSRIVSQHRHMCAPHAHAPSDIGPSIDEEVAKRTQFIDYSRYAMQIQPWIDTFGRDRVCILRFEDFVADRVGSVTAVHRFLGVEERPDTVDPKSRHNASDAKPVVVGGWKRIYNSPLYRRAVRPFLPLGVRDRLRATLLPRHDFVPEPPSLETVERIIESVRDDAERLRVIMGRSEPLWDFDAVQAKYATHAAPECAGQVR